MWDKLKNIFNIFNNKDGIQTDDDIIRKKRMMSFGVVLLIIIAILLYSYYSFVKKQKKLYASKPQVERGLLDEQERQTDWKARIESDFTELQKQNKELNEQIQALLKELEKEKQNETLQEEINRLIEEKQSKLLEEIEKKISTEEDKADGIDNKLKKDDGEKQVKTDEAKKVKMDILPPPPKPYKGEKEEKGYSQYYNNEYAKTTTSEADTTNTKEEEEIYVYKPSEASLDKESIEAESFYIPSGSFVRGVLLTGVDAPTMQVGKQEPQPVLINLNKETILPNRYRTNMIDCVGIGSARGDLSSERAYIRMVTISCIEENSGRKVVDTELQGWIIDEDGKIGLRGRLVSKQGSILAKALVAGFAEGVAKAFKQASSDISVTPEGSTSTIQSDKAFQAAGFEGVGTAMSKLADFYMKMAESMFPVIEVGAGRSVTIVVKDGKSFELVEKNIKDNPLKE